MTTSPFSATRSTGDVANWRFLSTALLGSGILLAIDLAAKSFFLPKTTNWADRIAIGVPSALLIFGAIYFISRHFAQRSVVSLRANGEIALRESEERYRRLVESSPQAIIVHSDGRFVFINPAGARLFGADRAEDLVGKPIMEVIHPDFREIASQRAHRIQVEKVNTPCLEQKLLRLDGETFWAEVTGIPVMFMGRPAAQLVVYDVTERKKAEAESRRQADRAEKLLRRTQALRKIDTAITGSLDLRMTLNVLLEQVLNELDVDAANVLLLSTPDQTLKYAAGRGFRGPEIQRMKERVGQGPRGRAVVERRTVRIACLREDDSTFACKPLLLQEGIVACFAVPLISKGKVKGVLEVFNRTPLDPDHEWLDFLKTLAGQAAIAIDSVLLFDDLERSNAELSLAYETTLEGWTAALDLRDKETEGHTQRVTEMTMQLARAMGVAESDLVHIRRGALLHDIGKMGIPDAILLKPGKLSEEEWETMRRHPTYAYELLSAIHYLRPALAIPYCHHEKMDGTGYPRGLKGHQIPRAARLFAVVDVWDALRSDRPYRPGWPDDKVREHIRTLSGTHFDPEVVEAFLKLTAPSVVPDATLSVGNGGQDSIRRRDRTAVASAVGALREVGLGAFPVLETREVAA